MNKVAHYLQEHLMGEVMTSADARAYFATDASIFRVVPSIIVYPRNENDVRKVARFTWQLAERGRVVPMTARGSGTDLGGGAIGSGIVLAFPAHMNRILELDSRAGIATVEPGMNFGRLQEALHTHGRFLPTYPASFEYSTIGGAVANNASGEKSFKYGSTQKYVRGLHVVLANGEVIETRRLSKRELGKKLGLATLEGEIYRSLDTLIEENQNLISQLPRAVTKNTAGYALEKVKHKDGSFDLTPLFIGAQGTLGIITEINLETEPYNPDALVIAAQFDDVRTADKVITELRKLSHVPCSIELVDGQLLQFIHKQNPNLLRGTISEPLPKIVLIMEFDNQSDRMQKKLAKKVAKLLEKNKAVYRIESDPPKREDVWRIRDYAAAAIAHTEGTARALPFIDDGIVPAERFADFFEAVQAMLDQNGIQASIWGHAGDANLHLQPMLDLSQVQDRQTVFRLMNDYYKLIIDMGGSTSAEHGDGRLRAPLLSAVYGPEVYGLFQKVKAIFDPYGTMNPGVKLDVSLADLRGAMRENYNLEHLYDHLPRS